MCRVQDRTQFEHIRFSCHCARGASKIPKHLRTYKASPRSSHRNYSAKEGDKLIERHQQIITRRRKSQGQETGRLSDNARRNVQRRAPSAPTFAKLYIREKRQQRQCPDMLDMGDAPD
jgi:hypothetical protein